MFGRLFHVWTGWGVEYVIELYSNREKLNVRRIPKLSTEIIMQHHLFYGKSYFTYPETCFTLCLVMVLTFDDDESEKVNFIPN